MPSSVSTILIALLAALPAFGAGWLAGRASRRASPADTAMEAENADLRRRMDELADALMANDTHRGS